MAAHSPEARRLHAKIMGITSTGGPDDPRLPALQREFRALLLEQRIREAVAAKPPFTEAQLATLAGYLRPSTEDAA